MNILFPIVILCGGGWIECSLLVIACMDVVISQLCQTCSGKSTAVLHITKLTNKFKEEGAIAVLKRLGKV